jgi:hypothetical protein
MAILTILFLDRYRSSTGLPALVPGVFPLGFLPLPCVRFSLPLFPTPVLQVPAISGFPPSFVYLRSMVFWYGLCFPPEGFGSVFPSFPPLLLSLPCGRSAHIGYTAAYSPPGDLDVPRALFRALIYRSDISDQWLRLWSRL